MANAEPTGTYACPICGFDHPHSHSDQQVAGYREDQIHRDDGWTNTAHSQPKERGWYLCAGIEIDPDQYGSPESFSDIHERWSQLSWFLWVRNGGRQGEDPPEVLYYDAAEGGWRLCNLLGNGVASGQENRRLVRAYPKYWRELPDVRRITTT